MSEKKRAKNKNSLKQASFEGLEQVSGPDDRTQKSYIGILEKVNRGLRAYIAEMTSVFRFIENVSSMHALDRVIRLLMDVLKELCAYDAAVVYLYEENGKNGKFKMAARDNDMVIKKIRKEMEIDDRIIEWVFRQGGAVIIPESFRKQHSDAFKNWSYMIAPLAVGEEKTGYIELAFNRPQGSFTQQMFSILNVLLKHATVILINERVYEKERKTARKYIELDMLKKDVVNTTTHEIKTPLTIIQASSILLEGDPEMKEEDRRELLTKITSQCRRIDLIVSELFETSQLEDHSPLIKKEIINLNEITAAVLKDIFYDKSKIDIKICIKDKIDVMADFSSLYKIIRNLTENAVKYTSDQGTIRITSAIRNDKVEWIISDQGVGIPEHEQEQIFDKFFRGGEGSTRRIGGIGLGLYIVKRNVELNDGSISVKSQVGKGSTFTVTLPKAG